MRIVCLALLLLITAATLTARDLKLAIDGAATSGRCCGGFERVKAKGSACESTSNTRGLNFIATLPDLRRDVAPTAVTFSVELRRGFNAATYATRDAERPEIWIEGFEGLLQISKNMGTNSGAFILGAQFGFSYRVAEYERRDFSLNAEHIRPLVMRGALARLACEQQKYALGATDADLLRVLALPHSAFAAWKSSLATSDPDSTVIDTKNWLLL